MLSLLLKMLGILMLVGMVDVIFSDVAQPDQARITLCTSSKPEVISSYQTRPSCIDSTIAAEVVFAQEVKKLQADQFKPREQVTLEPLERDHACVVGSFRVSKKANVSVS